MSTRFPDYRRLATLMVNIVHWDSNQQWRRALVDFVRDDVRDRCLEYAPEHYIWADFEEWIAYRFGYNRRKHIVFFVPFGLRHKSATEVTDVNAWEDILNNIADRYVIVSEYIDICFLIMNRKDPLEIPRGYLSHLYPLQYVEHLDSSPTDNGIEFSPSFDLFEAPSPPFTPTPPSSLASCAITVIECVADDPQLSPGFPAQLDGQDDQTTRDDFQDINVRRLLESMGNEEDGESDYLKQRGTAIPTPANNPRTRTKDSKSNVPKQQGTTMPTPANNPRTRTEDNESNYSKQRGTAMPTPAYNPRTRTEESKSDYPKQRGTAMPAPANNPRTGADAGNSSRQSFSSGAKSNDNGFDETSTSEAVSTHFGSRTSGSSGQTCPTTQDASGPGSTRLRAESSNSRGGSSRIPTATKTNTPTRGSTAVRGTSTQATPSAQSNRTSSSRPTTAKLTTNTRIPTSRTATSTRTTRTATPPRPTTRTPSVTPPLSSSPPTYGQLSDLPAAAYSTTSDTDTDYGAANLSFIDTYVGSYNTGNTPAAWQACLDFFNIDFAEYNKREALASKADGGGRKRVPMKKLPGMSVGLFDYQLVGTWNLLRLVLGDVSGGLLCDEQGLGKTQEMYGVMALAWGLRRCKGQVKAAWKKGLNAVEDGKRKESQHNAPGSAARACPFDERYGFRCYCYNELTRELADRVPEGPNIMVAPTRNCASMIKDAKTKLDVKQLKIRGYPEGVDNEDKLTPAEIKSLRATIDGTADEDGKPVFQYQAGAGQSDYVIVVSPENITPLNGTFNIEVNVANSADPPKKKSSLLPGMVLMDEFHEYAFTKNGKDSRTVAWLHHLKKCTLESQQPAPLAYFVSGTPFGQTPADIRPAISLFEKDNWRDESHPLSGATLTSFDDLTVTFERLTEIQAGGEVVPTPEIADYRRRLDCIFKHMMVRRLGTDLFQGRNLTDTGPLKVKITDHRLPSSVMDDDLQALADRTREQACAAAAATGQDINRLLRSKTGEDLLLKLRLASTFPGIAGPSAANFTFTPAEIHSEFSGANNDLTKTSYFPHIPLWAANSPKLETINKTIATMLSDNSKIPGENSHAKKYCIFTPLEAEALLIHAYLLYKANLNRPSPKSKSPQSQATIKPVLLHTALPQPARQKLLEAFLTQGNAPPNILISPLSLAGTGLNLQKARYLTITGPAWTKRENQQAYYRIHRVGQKMETRLQLLTGRWNPAERVILGGYEGREVGGERVWEVGNEFCADKEGDGEGGLVERHQRLE